MSLNEVSRQITTLDDHVWMTSLFRDGTVPCIPTKQPLLTLYRPTTRSTGTSLRGRPERTFPLVYIHYALLPQSVALASC